MAVGPSEPDDFLELATNGVEDFVIRLSGWLGLVSDYEIRRALIIR